MFIHRKYLQFVFKNNAHPQEKREFILMDNKIFALFFEIGVASILGRFSSGAHGHLHAGQEPELVANKM